MAGMTLVRALLRIGQRRPSWRRLGDAAFEVLGAVALVTFLETLGPHAPNDGVDLLVALAMASLGFLGLRRLRRGRLPLARLLLGPAARWLRRRLLALTPRHAVGFRPGAEPARDDPALKVMGHLLFAGTAVVVLLGPMPFGALAWTKAQVSYTLYLGLLALVWGALSVTIVFGTLAAAQWSQERGRRGGRPGALARALLGAAWVGALLAAASLPGVVLLLLIVLLGIGHALRLRDPLVQGYLFCRRDGAGRPLGIPVEAFALRTYVVLVLAVAFTVALGLGPRLVEATRPQGAFGFTGWLAVLAGLCGLLLVHRTGVQVHRLLGGAGDVPELPLVPTAWLPDPAAAGGPRWRALAREHGWFLAEGPRPPAAGYDLVVGTGAHPRRLVPPPDDLADAEVLFRLRRRLDVVLRRAIHRRLHRLFKALKAEADEATGSGYLFCPHVWLVPGVVRDGEVAGPPGPLQGPRVHGEPYARAFALRQRRYLGRILRRAEVDILYWEDAIQWADLRRVLGVLYEQVDQGRVPVEERHFQGLPRVRVVVQEEDAEPEPPPAGGAPAAGKARLLLVLKDRGRGEEAHAPDPSTRRRVPSLV